MSIECDIRDCSESATHDYHMFVVPKGVITLCAKHAESFRFFAGTLVERPLTLYRVELRASPDTLEEEERARRQGRVLGPQTVVYTIGGTSAEDAERRAVEAERAFLYRVNVRVMGPTYCVEGLSDYPGKPRWAG